MIDVRKKMISELLALGLSSPEDLFKHKRLLAKKYGQPMPTNAEMLSWLPKNAKADKLRRLLRRRAVRTMSGIAPVAVLTKPFACPGKCAYCPTEKDVPQSYLSNEPAVMRAIRCGYDPYKQVTDRLRALEANGHEPTKIELIVIGGTWSVLPINYKYWYVLNCFAAANDFSSGKGVGLRKKKYSANLGIDKLRTSLIDEQRKNEKAKYKLIGVTLETRPDYIDDGELEQMRELGCTRVELGVQAIDEKILVLNKRGHGVNCIAKATAKLKAYGFKVTYHLMPGLPGATAKKDLSMFKELFSDERFQPDQIKFYPTVVTKGSLLYKWWQQGTYKPYSDKQLQKLIIDCKQAVPRYVRIIRLIRDIPGESIIAGNTVTNLRQVMQQQGVLCECIRCRETKGQAVDGYKLKLTDYRSASGIEYFIEACSKDGKILYGFCRLRLPDNGGGTPKLLEGDAIVRELHVYGELVSVGGDKKVQHAGLGKVLLAEAEKIASSSGFEGIAVISGVGVRGYYRKMGYKLKHSYMLKKLTSS
ncbi:tRNA uridine(34) 5-carboxymethylaminomethyl modification radical SAM/GNAT enzyme Elp3 [Candidatus Falkowbacteria bacterium]|nr:tRNA uridine(34) 5-carboxymethylaminomethyl modification radical SAM/GNAT enzyme Elp3 [Candidatus Falkowbacteria bacterium]